MNDVSIKNKMQKLNLSGMMDQYEYRLEQALTEQWAHSLFLDMLLTDALERKNNRQLILKLSKSKLDVSKTVETFDFKRKDLVIPIPLIRELLTCNFIEKQQNIFIFGKSGLGKSHIAQAIGLQACRQGYDVLFQCVHELMNWIYAGTGDGTRNKRLTQVIKTSLLIIDDFGLQELNEEQQKDLYRIIAEKYEKKSIILTTNRSIEEWPSIFFNSLVGSAAVDRLVHRGVEVFLDGPSHRFAEYIKSCKH
jgi:DNA replication protein DnaC